MKRGLRASGVRGPGLLAVSVVPLALCSCSGRKAEPPVIPGPAAFIVEVGESFTLVAPPPTPAGAPGPGYAWSMRKRHAAAVVSCAPDGSVRVPAAPELPVAIAAAKTPLGPSPSPSAEPSPAALATPAPASSPSPSRTPVVTALVPRWRCVGATPGRTTIELAYARPGETDVGPARIALFLIDVL